jgi:hypothetical protein
MAALAQFQWALPLPLPLPLVRAVRGLVRLRRAPAKDRKKRLR